MKLAIMQPYFLPYLGYWQLINAVDTFVIYDNIQFSRNGWFNRNNILLNGKKKLFSIPLKKDSNYLNVVDRYLADDCQKEIQRIVSQVKNSYRNARYFTEVFPIIENIFLNKEKNLFRYVLYSVERICDYLDIETEIVKSSEVKINHNLKSQDKVIAIVTNLMATKYINPIGGLELYDYKKFSKEGVNLIFLQPEIKEYPQFNNIFIPCLSIIDIMMFNSSEEIKGMLKDYVLR